MSVRVRRWLIVALLAVCLAAPVADLLDCWDSGGNDVEGGIVVLVLCVGLGLLLRVAVPGSILFARAAKRPAATTCVSANDLAAVVHRPSEACIGGPPVLPLRV